MDEYCLERPARFHFRCDLHREICFNEYVSVAGLFPVRDLRYYGYRCLFSETDGSLCVRVSDGYNKMNLLLDGLLLHLVYAGEDSKGWEPGDPFMLIPRPGIPSGQFILHDATTGEAKVLPVIALEFLREVNAPSGAIDMPRRPWGEG